MMQILPNHRRARTAAILLAMSVGACGQPAARPAPAPPPAPPPAPVPPPVASVDPWRDVQVCVVDEQGVREIAARYNVTTGDTLVGGRPFAEVYPLTDAYAQNAEWFINNEMMEQPPYRYGKYGIPYHSLAYPLKRIGEYRGVMLFAEVRDSGGPYSGLFVAVRPDCAFQAYSSDLLYGSVRG
ncbi:MAG TPA: hypothetical protein VLK84_24670 [Longimicrobium sp.]|nr:hypothetical protein [Longimicrobium sp.]